jgi:hypothetical protein
MYVFTVIRSGNALSHVFPALPTQQSEWFGVGLGGQLFSAGRPKPQHSLDTNTQILQQLQDKIFWHVSGTILNQKTHTTILWGKL